EGGNSDLAALVTLSLSGGAGLSGNWVPHDEQRNLLPTYNRLGMGALTNSNVDRTEFGGGPFVDSSKVLAGIRTGSTPSTRDKTAFVGVCVVSQDDSSNNKFDITGMAAKAGLEGSLLKNLGTQNTETGTKHQYAFVQPPSPLTVGRYDDIVSALGVAGSLNKLSQTQKGRLFKMVEELSTSQARRIASYSGGTTLGNLIRCATGQNKELMNNSDPGTSPLNNAALSTAWNINNNTATNNRDFVFAAMVYNALKGNCGSINLELGGYDYHGNPRTTTDARDLQAGETIGRILESFAIMGKPGLVYVCSDGAVGSVISDTQEAQFQSDRGGGGSAMIFAYHPNGRPRTNGFQLGHFNSGQQADDKHFVGGSPQVAAAVVFANYLSLSGRLDLFDTRILSTGQLDEAVTIFKPV
ncbi:MAG: hypothetical protein KDD35_09945, partial [Bdellovibrionales bacterium]|nr:hypothetical protein [Bdellovibrionales bacterium]